MSVILITGASSGLGAALARHYAGPGIRLILWGRDAVRLGVTASECQGRAAIVDQTLFDLRDVERTIRELREADRKHPIDLVIFNAGLGGIAAPEHPIEASERSYDIATVNFTSTIAGATTIADLMQQRGRGRIAIIGSVAEAFPLPMAPSYSGAKAGLRLFSEALDLRLRQYGVAVTLISPGFIETPMSRQLKNPMPFLIGVNEAASMVADKISRKTRHAIIPWQMALLCGISRWLPRIVTHWVLQRF